MTAVPVTDIVDLVGGRYEGPRDRAIRGVSTLAEAGEGELAFLGNASYAPQVATTRAEAVLVPADFAGDDPRFIRVGNPHAALARVVARWFDRPALRGVSPLASVAASARLGRNVAVGAFAFIGENVVVGDDTAIHPNVSIYDGSIIGQRCILHSGVVIGSDGYSYTVENGRHVKIPQVGIVRIEDDVEIGANSCVDRAGLGETVIGEGTKIDNLVQIGHGVKIGKHCLLVAQVGVAGSTQLGDYVVVAGQSGFSGHLKIGDRAQVAAKSAVLADVPAGTKVMGSPAVPFREFVRREAALRKLAQRRTLKGEPC
jgi:UDP-3-O-[3-hydroxymyristoyl] glucosamine N-acyltransferase